MRAPPSGKFVIRMPTDLHATLKRESMALGVSLNEHCVRLLSSGTKLPAVDNIISQSISAISKRYGDSLIGIVMFGSRVRGDFHDDSDLDLLVILDNSIIIKRELYRDENLSLAQGVSLHFTHMPQDLHSSGSIFLECAVEGVVLFDKRRSVNSLLTSLRSYILSGKAIRKETHGQGFWLHT